MTNEQIAEALVGSIVNWQNVAWWVVGYDGQFAQVYCVRCQDIRAGDLKIAQALHEGTWLSLTAIGAVPKGAV